MQVDKLFDPQSRCRVGRSEAVCKQVTRMEGTCCSGQFICGMTLTFLTLASFRVVSAL